MHDAISNIAVFQNALQRDKEALSNIWLWNVNSLPESVVFRALSDSHGQLDSDSLA